ncbi:cytochrome c biogenesis protein CcdA [Cyclobacterium qasimii]|uniref:Cytochrome c-type biogenesis protein DsbD, protein-disulfide reductase n=2 Tax=Cyclobacterium qasimii TaxID=1350429 RepID=S7VH97_9BACT|nr:cytochrome c biogenesis protein CcdA [Cyclobacterium qasimii]EPR69595.1 Cytochrome c-type biogenesis protein DsbD, protein-disulfide reductase [Cyclobacterium qasimii M12-11B]GEO21431.1 peptide permease [Cyclobacterium qasimii]
MKKSLILLTLTLTITQVQAQSVFDQLNGWVGSQLAESTGFGAYFFLFMGGVLASLLPCVYPVYPLTVSFLRNKKSKLGKFAHPLTYYFGLAAIYFIFGLIASATGGAFNDILRLPLANLSIGLLLIILALATVDYLHLPFFGGQLDSKQEGLSGTLLMGAGAGLLSSACVGPIVVSILVAIASNVEGVTIGLAATAAFKMMLFGFGVGVPVLLLGVFGLALPKSGKWMLYVQWVFAVLIGYFAYGYLIKGFNGLGLTDSVGTYIFIGSVLVFLAAFNLQKADKSNQLKTKAALYTLTGVIGFFIIGANTLSSGNIPISQSQAAGVATSPNIEQKGALSWYLNKEVAYQKAAETGKLVFVDFHGDWCTNCKAFQKNTQEDKALNTSLQNAILYKVYDTSPEFEKYRNDPRFPELKVGIPFFIITDASGNVIYKTNDYTKTDEMQLFLN